MLEVFTESELDWFRNYYNEQPLDILIKIKKELEYDTINFPESTERLKPLISLLDDEITIRKRDIRKRKLKIILEE